MLLFHKYVHSIANRTNFSLSEIKLDYVDYCAPIIASRNMYFTSTVLALPTEC